jgi:NAD(P)-dependent dehydrogenase (short-subunit alcohol dehydrogenase family)
MKAVALPGGLRVYEGAVAIVTGAASGIGCALAGELVRRGASVVLADIQAAEAETAAASLRAAGGSASASAFDVSDFESVRRLVERVADDHGRLDFVFNNAGIAAGGEVREQTVAAWNRIVDVNLRGVVHGVHAAYPIMVRQGFGHIVNTASMAGLVCSPLTTSYSATKHAVVGLSKGLRVEAAGLGVRVSVLCPGVIRTPLLSGGRYGIFLDTIPEQEQRDAALRYFERFRPMDVRVFAAKVLDRVARNRAIIVLPAWWKIVWWLERLSPTLGLALAERLVAAARRDLAAASGERDSSSARR